MAQQEEPDDFEVAPRRFDVELFIVHPTMDPAEITAALGIEPQHVHAVGEPRRTPKGKVLPRCFPDTRWRHSVRYEVKDQWFATGVSELADRLLPHNQFLSKIRSTGGTACLIIQFLGDDYFGDKIPRETLAKLVSLELDLGIECFMMPQS